MGRARNTQDAAIPERRIAIASRASARASVVRTSIALCARSRLASPDLERVISVSCIAELRSKAREEAGEATAKAGGGHADGPAELE